MAYDLTKHKSTIVNSPTGRTNMRSTYLNIDGSERLKHFLRGNMVIAEDKDKWAQRYNRVKFLNPYYAFENTTEYLFFVKPRLNITLGGYAGSKTKHRLNPELADLPFWVEMNEKYHRVIEQLQYSASTTGNPFSPMLFNSVMSPLDLPSVSSETIQTASTIYGTNIEYRGSSYKSDEGFDFSLQFFDNKELEMYHYFKMYDEYQKLKAIGAVSPPFKSLSGNKDYTRSNVLNDPQISDYTINKVLHDQIGIYKFIVDSDMSTLLHYSYAWGCFPKSSPRDSFDTIQPGLLTHSVDWHGQFIEDMNPQILAEFNMLTASYRTNVTKTATNKYNKVRQTIWSDKYDEINGNWMAVPVIREYDDPTRNTGKRYCLEWYRNYNDNKQIWTGK